MCIRQLQPNREQAARSLCAQKTFDAWRVKSPLRFWNRARLATSLTELIFFAPRTRLRRPRFVAVRANAFRPPAQGEVARPCIRCANGRNRWQPYPHSDKKSSLTVCSIRTTRQKLSLAAHGNLPTAKSITRSCKRVKGQAV